MCLTLRGWGEWLGYLFGRQSTGLLAVSQPDFGPSVNWTSGIVLLTA